MKFEVTPANIIAKLISAVVHPMLMPIFGAYLIFSLPSDLKPKSEDTVRLFLLGTIFICTCVLPAAIIIFLKLTGTIESVSLNNQHDRRIPFIFTGICYTACYYAIGKLQLPHSLLPYGLAYPLMLGATVSLILALVINTWFKISIHMMGIGGVLGSFIAIAIKFNYALTPFILLLIAIAGLTGFARLQLNAHTPAQVYSGFTLSVVANALLLMFL